MSYSNEYFIIDYEKLCYAKCPICKNQFAVQDCSIERGFTCVKCGSEWYARRKKITELSLGDANE